MTTDGPDEERGKNAFNPRIFRILRIAKGAPEDPRKFVKFVKLADQKPFGAFHKDL
jgi:hypothetical protein